MASLPGAVQRTRDGLLILLCLVLAGAIVVTTVARLRPPPTESETGRLLRADPLNPDALRTLALARARAGRTDEADGLFAFIGRRTWRDGPAQVWLFQRRIQEGRFDAAVENIDALLRRDANGEARPALFGLMVEAAAIVEARPSVVRRLDAAPWWRTDFLQTLASKGEAPTASAVLLSLSEGPTPPTPTEYAPLVQRLVREGDYAGALGLWRQVARPRAAANAAIRDTDFSGPSDTTPFTWSVADGVGATSVFEPPTGLRVDYDGFSLPALPAQLLVLPPGRYEITWREADESHGAARVDWRVRCAPSGAILAKAGDWLTNAGSWQDRSMVAEIPATGCGAQWLELAAQPGERRSETTQRFSAIRLTGAALTGR